jgi:nucleoside-diphosphate-sugar epimerase
MQVCCANPSITDNLNRMRVLVTGATGFIGNYVVQELLKLNVQVIATSASEAKAKKKPWFTSVTYVTHDIYSMEKENLFEKFKSPNFLIHLAWGNLINFKSPDHIDKELPAHKLFLENLIANGLHDLTVIGTCLEYGMQEGCLTEDMECMPTIAYPIAKHNLRLYLETYKLKYNFSLKWIRLFYMYGDGQAEKSILPSLDRAIANREEVFNMSKGDQMRDYLSINEVSRNIVTFALQRKIYGVINCCSGKPISLRKLVTDHLNRVNKKIKLNLGYYPYSDYEPMRFWGSTNKSKTILDDYMSFNR